jgi:C_GCAxxG_C_C family probable redox protein
LISGEVNGLNKDISMELSDQDSLSITKSSFERGYNCAQAVLLGFASRYGLEEERGLRIASGFGGGMGRLGQVCGAVTGAFMVIGLHTGYADPADQDAKDRTLRMVNAFSAEFIARHDSIHCPTLLGVHLGEADGYQQAKEQNLFGTLCPIFIESAVKILIPLLDQSV